MDCWVRIALLEARVRWDSFNTRSRLTFSPFLIFCGGGGLPAVQAVELDV